MFVTDIVLKNAYGCEIARETVKENETVASCLVRVVKEEMWDLGEGDTISFEQSWRD